MVIYRDTKTGQFASKKQWRLAKKRGSKRFKRQQVKRKPKRIELPIEPTLVDFTEEYEHGETEEYP